MKYRVTISDRKYRRTVEADSGKDAVRAAVGLRLYSLQEDYYLPGGGGAWRVNVAVSRPRNGFTPVREINAYVEVMGN